MGHGCPTEGGWIGGYVFKRSIKWWKAGPLGWINWIVGRWMGRPWVVRWFGPLIGTPLSDRNVAKRRYITPKLFIVISFFFPW